MSAEYSTKEVRAASDLVRNIAGGDGTNVRARQAAADVLGACADRIEADERAALEVRGRLRAAVGELVWVWTEVWPLVHSLTSRETVRARFRGLPDLIAAVTAAIDAPDSKR